MLLGLVDLIFAEKFPNACQFRKYSFVDAILHVPQVLPRERKKHEYLEAVKNRYKHLPEVKRIVRYVCPLIMSEMNEYIDILLKPVQIYN